MMGILEEFVAIKDDPLNLKILKADAVLKSKDDIRDAIKGNLHNVDVLREVALIVGRTALILRGKLVTKDGNRAIEYMNGDGVISYYFGRTHN